MSFRRQGRIWVPEAPHLLLRRTIELEVQTPALRFEGWFDVKLIHAKTGFVKRHLRFRNLITNAALDALAAAGMTPNAQTSWVAVGTGGTAPAATDTSLVSEIAPRIGRTLSTAGSGPSFTYWYQKYQATFTETQANGTLTEIGLFSANAAGTMWTRQLFKDGTGTPTAITKTASDQLQITYEMRLYSPTADSTGVVVISGVNYNYTVRPSAINDTAYWGAGGMLTNFNVGGTAGATSAFETDVLGSTSGLPAGASSDATSNTFGAYAGGTYRRDVTSVWDPGVGNFATGIGSMRGGTPNSSVGRPFQWSFTPKIPKDATKRLTIINRISWGRYP